MRRRLAPLLALAAAPALAQSTAPLSTGSPSTDTPSISPVAIAPATPAPSTPASEMPVPPASRWDSLPRLAYKPTYKPRQLWVERARKLATDGTCAFKPGPDKVVRLSVPFVVLLDGGARVQDAHADYPACPALAALVETFGRALGPTLLVAPAGAPPPVWRASHFYAGWQE